MKGEARILFQIKLQLFVRPSSAELSLFSGEVGALYDRTYSVQFLVGRVDK